MKATAIIKGVTSQFWEGFGSVIKGFDNLTPEEQLQFCTGNVGKDLGITVKIGDGSFRDRIAFHDLLKSSTVSSSKSLRRGYILITFEISDRKLTSERK